MDLAAYLGSVIFFLVIALGAMYTLTRQMGHRIDDLHVVVNARFDDMSHRFDDVNSRFDDMNKPFEGIDGRLDGIDHRLVGVETRLARVEVRLDGFHERDHPQG